MKRVIFIISIIFVLVPLSACVALDDNDKTLLEINPQPEFEFPQTELIAPEPVEPEMPECINKEDGLENDSDMEINIGIIYGNIYYNGVAISRLFKESFVDVFGEYLSDTDNMHFYYEGLVVSVVVEYGKEEQVHQLTVSYVDLFELNGVSLDMSSKEFISIFGVPNRIVGDSLFIYYVTNFEITYTLTLELHEYDYIKKIVGVRLFLHNW